jgi:serine/threonine protein kinase
MVSCVQVQFLGAVTKTQPYMIITEYMSGGSLNDLFKAQRFPSIWRAVQLALDCARGLAYMHSRGPVVGGLVTCPRQDTRVTYTYARIIPSCSAIQQLCAVILLVFFVVGGEG